jgi:hypothetical protein
MLQFWHAAGDARCVDKSTDRVNKVLIFGLEPAPWLKPPPPPSRHRPAPFAGSGLGTPEHIDAIVVARAPQCFGPFSNRQLSQLSVTRAADVSTDRFLYRSSWPLW